MVPNILSNANPKYENLRRSYTLFLDFIKAKKMVKLKSSFLVTFVVVLLIGQAETRCQDSKSWGHCNDRWRN